MRIQICVGLFDKSGDWQQEEQIWFELENLRIQKHLPWYPCKQNWTLCTDPEKQSKTTPQNGSFSATTLRRPQSYSESKKKYIVYSKEQENIKLKDSNLIWRNKDNVVETKGGERLVFNRPGLAGAVL